MSPRSRMEPPSEWFATTRDLVVDVPTAAELLGIGRGSGYEAVRTGQIPSLRLGRRIVVPVAKLRAMVGLDEFGNRRDLRGRHLKMSPAERRSSTHADFNTTRTVRLTRSECVGDLLLTNNLESRGSERRPDPPSLLGASTHGR